MPYSAIIIDNSTNARKSLASILKKNLEMEDIYSCSTGREAVATLRQVESINWVFCDSNIQDKDWIELLAEFKKLPSTANAKYILLSAESKREMLLQAASAGVKEFICKPFSPKTVLAKIHKLAQGKEQRKSTRVTLLEAIEAIVEFDDVKYDTSLVDVSLGGCMIRSKVFNKGGGFIFDVAKIQIPLKTELVEVSAELIRLERDTASEEKHIFAAFLFQDLSKESAKHLSTFLAKVKEPTKTKESPKEPTSTKPSESPNPDKAA